MTGATAVYTVHLTGCSVLCKLILHGPSQVSEYPEASDLMHVCDLSTLLVKPNLSPLTYRVTCP